MANFVPSALVAGQAKFSDKMQSGEWRLPDSIAFNAASQAEIANPSLKDLRTREDRAVHAYFPIRQAATNGSSRAYNHTGTRSDSIDKTITWTTFSEPFTISLKQADNNVFTFADMFAAAEKNGLYNLIARIDAWFAAALVADKTQINVGGGNGGWIVGDLNYEVPLTEQNFFFQNARQMMELNLFRGALIAIADDKATVLSQRLQALGSANAVNYAFQFQGMTILPTTRTILGSGYNGSAIVYENGLVAVSPWIPKQNRKPLDPNKAMEYNGDYGMINTPSLPGVDIAIHAYAQRADNSALGGYTQDLTMEFELSVDMAYQSAPLSTFRGASDSVVYAIGQLAS
jgi:hypothetical protein